MKQRIINDILDILARDVYCPEHGELVCRVTRKLGVSLTDADQIYVENAVRAYQRQIAEYIAGLKATANATVG